MYKADVNTVLCSHKRGNGSISLLKQKMDLVVNSVHSLSHYYLHMKSLIKSYQHGSGCESTKNKMSQSTSVVFNSTTPLHLGSDWLSQVPPHSDRQRK